MKHNDLSSRKNTLKDVAELAGVAISTVSRALSGHPAISEATRDAVQAAAGQLGYRMPMQGRKLRKSATKIIGVVVGALHNPFITSLIAHLHDAFDEAGYHMILIIDSMSESNCLQKLRPLVDGYLDGLILATATLDSPVVAELKRRVIPLVLVIRSVDDPTIDTVEIDNVHAGAEAARHLFELGHRRIGLVMGPRNTSTSRDRAEGALSWLEGQGIERQTVPLIHGLYTMESGYSSAVTLLSASHPVSAIIAGNDTMALGVLEAAKRKGIAVPHQLSVLGFDDMPLAGTHVMSLTTIRQPVETMAHTAARRLLDRINGVIPGTGSRDVLPIHLIQRETTAAWDTEKSIKPDSL
ncbi:LacI family DNA-binding transcriptional regulator [Alcaligenes sp. SDU_A2]|uniref:LacI family DNA-binding transcriptional regulator n=1 Tax=Alcaligenes sp. SDU_A2 TaxID=3136634 RepID=UPI002C08E9C3|nr:LacI family DNA-binding transcriptional regulator [Alcaligenes sp.]HRL26484.1 LacI family DNA-binding transcriptional regulator [Alcaligenes sp.]